MPELVVARYTREEIQSNPDKIYVFGDNLARQGYGGQAKEARDEPNAIGIPTKFSPYDFLTDDDFDAWLPIAIQDCNRIRKAQEDGKTIVWPKDGIGTGLAALEKHAPKIWRKLQEMIADLRKEKA